jgi:hypothetical protein
LQMYDSMNGVMVEGTVMLTSGVDCYVGVWHWE